MSTANGVLALLKDSTLLHEVERTAAAVGVRILPSATLPSRRAWVSASAVVLDETTVATCVTAGLPRRDRVIVLTAGEAPENLWKAAISIGAQRVLRLPSDEQTLVAVFADVDESASHTHSQGRTIAVIGGRGGCGASVFSGALAQAAADALLIDLDPWGGGLDLLLGGEHRPGLRWPDLAVPDGRLNPSALREALPSIGGVTVLSTTRSTGDVAAGSLRAVVEAGRRGSLTVICDLPRRLTAASEAAIDTADLVVIIGQCDVRCCASIAAMTPTLLAVNPNVGLVVRGPAPGGLRASELARMADLPLLAAIRAEPGLAEALERGGLRLRRRSALAGAARRVLAVLDRQPVAAPVAAPVSPPVWEAA